MTHWAPTQATTISPLNYYLILKSYLLNRHFQVKIEDSYTGLLPVNAGVPQGSILGPLLYLLYTADLPTSPNSTIATFADDTAILATDPDPAIATQKLQTSLPAIWNLLTKSRLKANSSKYTHVTFTTRKATCPGVHIYNEQLFHTEVEYLGLHLDRRLTWRKHIFAKRKHLGITFSKMYWLLGRKSKLSICNKLIAYKAILKPIWTYGIQLCGSVSISNIEILEHFQGKVLRMITDAPWYVPNMVLRQDLQVTSVKEEIHRFSTQQPQSSPHGTTRALATEMYPLPPTQLSERLPTIQSYCQLTKT
jgi:hypothetical protein